MYRLLGFMFVLCLVGQPSFGDDNTMGQNPTGYIVFNAEGRVFLV
jgi:hypothetical protein